METKIKLIIADDELKMREALKSFLSQKSFFEILGEAENGREVLDKLNEKEVDIVLMDLEMPLMGGAEALRIMRVRYPNIKVVILSVYNDFSTIRDCVFHGAKGYVSKDKIITELINTLLMVYEKGFYFDDEISALLLQDFVSENLDSVKKMELNIREREILKELKDGKSVKEIADKLNVSVDTIKYHKKNIYLKTGSHSLAQALKNTNENNRLIN